MGDICSTGNGHEQMQLRVVTGVVVVAFSVERSALAGKQFGLRLMLLVAGDGYSGQVSASCTVLELGLCKIVLQQRM